jgi:hypothetical protein
MLTVVLLVVLGRKANHALHTHVLNLHALVLK